MAEAIRRADTYPVTAHDADTFLIDTGVGADDSRTVLSAWAELTNNDDDPIDAAGLAAVVDTEPDHLTTILHRCRALGVVAERAGDLRATRSCEEHSS